ncbi:MAG TPA: GNAT family N-acetyltransferase [Ignavibacteria bacterium]|nr:GNAT family N-acetyltransferase [Ignavibacteria bacterium]HMR39102.1 GNAT family N-acetyltransferase [Ignavibacteria bacterium]
MEIIKVRIEELETVSVLFDLYRQFYEQASDIDSAKEFLKDRITKNESVIFVAMDTETNSGMGFVQLYPAFSSVFMKRIWILNDLFVHEDHRKKGVAESLIMASKGLAEKTDAKGLILETHSTNHSAQKLYDKIGFKKDEEHFYYFLEV